MVTKQSAPNDELRVMLGEAIQAYEHAQIARLHGVRQAEIEHRESQESLNTTKLAKSKKVTAESSHEMERVSAEKRRVGDILSAIEEVEKTSLGLLEKAGLAHIAGAPLHADNDAGLSRKSNEDLAAVFAIAQTARVELRVLILRLAQIYVKEQKWEDAARILTPLLENRDAPIYTDARNLSRLVCLNLAQQALDSGHLENAKNILQGWIDGRDDLEIKSLLCETYYRLGLNAIEAKNLLNAAHWLRDIWQIDSNYKDTTLWPTKYSLSSWHAGQVDCIAVYKHPIPDTVTAIAFSPNGGEIACASNSRVAIWDIVDRVLLSEFTSVSSVVHLAYKDEKTLTGVFIDSYGTKSFILRKGSGNSIIGGSYVSWEKSSVSEDGQFHVSTRINELVIKDRAGNILATLYHPAKVIAFAFSLSSNLLASSCPDGTVRVWGPKGYVPDAERPKSGKGRLKPKSSPGTEIDHGIGAGIKVSKKQSRGNI